MAFNIWTPQGKIALGGMLGTYSNPNVLYESPKQVLGGGGSCFKMWCAPKNGGTGINYFESNDGLTSWTGAAGNPIVAAAAGVSFPTLYKVGSTYYLYTGPFPGGAGISVRTSSDGITFGSPTLAIAIGAGSWESTGVAQLNLVPGTSAPYVAYYEGVGASGSAMISATSTDLITWTKGNVTNPIFQGVAPLTFQFINGVYYAWGPNGSVPPSLNPGQSALGYNGITRWSATSPLGPWTSLKVPGSATQPAAVIYPSIRDDFDNTGTNLNTVGANISDPYILSALGNMYFYWSQTSPVGVQNNINCAVATGVTPAQQVSGYEGMLNFPMPMFDGNLTVAGSDTFQRADANPIGGNWTTFIAGVANQLSSNFMEAAPAPPSNGQSYWNAVAFPNDQWTRITIHNTAHASNTGVLVRGSTVGVNTAYFAYWNGNIGTNGTLNLQKNVAGAGTVLGSLSGLKISADNTLMLAISGTNLLAYYNGFPVLAATDASIAAGSAGAWTGAPSVVTDSQISAWSGGGFVANPFSPPSVGGSGYAIGSSNRCCSHGLTSQAIF